MNKLWKQFAKLETLKFQVNWSEYETLSFNLFNNSLWTLRKLITKHLTKKPL